MQVYEVLKETGRFRCDETMLSFPELKAKYQWLVTQMKKRIGEPPEGVHYPVWAWHTENWIHKKPDLRSHRWHSGVSGEQFVCIEFDIDENEVLLSDFDAWSIILLDGFITSSEAEDNELSNQMEQMPFEEQNFLRKKNWERVFDLTPLENEWMTNGKYIQATFWELKLEQIRKIRFFTAA